MSDEDDKMIRTLAALAPIAQADPMTIAYEAGRRSTHASATRWRIATTSLAIGLAAATLPLRTSTAPHELATAPPPPSMQNEVTPRLTAPRPPPTPRSPDNVIALRDAVLAHGLDGMPKLPPVPAHRERPLDLQKLLKGDL